jgi:hypothetical protein
MPHFYFMAAGATSILFYFIYNNKYPGAWFDQEPTSKSSKKTPVFDIPSRHMTEWGTVIPKLRPTSPWDGKVDNYPKVSK